MDYNAFVEIFNREFGEDFELERGCSYSLIISRQDVIKILGAAPPEGVHVAIKVDLMETAGGQVFYNVARRLDALPGGKDKNHEE